MTSLDLVLRGMQIDSDDQFDNFVVTRARAVMEALPANASTAILSPVVQAVPLATVTAVSAD